jgi:hypothetical protein
LTATEDLRLQAIETALNDIQTAINALATKTQLKQLLNIRQAEIEDLKQRVSSLETQILVLQNPNPF